MADAIITEFSGTRKGPVTRYFQYSRDGVRVLDAGKKVQRLYIFGPSADMMTERDTAVGDKILGGLFLIRTGCLKRHFRSVSGHGHSGMKTGDG